MRVLPIAVLAVACGGGHKQVTGPPPPPAAAPGFDATRWVPAAPTYVVAARSVKTAQQALTDVADTLAMPFGGDAHDLSRVFEQILGVDALSADAVSNIGVDLNGGIALFSEATNPTFVVHVVSPEALAAFFDHQRELGLRTQSVIVEGTEVFTASLGRGTAISWALDKDWLWVHFALGLDKEQGADWLAHSRHPAGSGWTQSWQWAQHGAHDPGLVGFVAARDLIAKIMPRAAEAQRCLHSFDPVGRVGVTIEGDTKHVGGRLSFELAGDTADRIGKTILPLPPGWASASEHAPISAQWNLDLDALQAWLAPCGGAIGFNLHMLSMTGVKSARAMLLALDPDDKSGSGALAADLSSKKFLEEQLDNIPHRSLLESSRTFGPLKGKRLSVPFIATVDYVLQDNLGIAAMGDGLLDKIATGASAPTSTILAIDIAPPALPEKTWAWLFEQIGLRGRAIADHLVRWRDGHVLLKTEQGALVLDAVGNRR